jgi:WD40 repeat protein
VRVSSVFCEARCLLFSLAFFAGAGAEGDDGTELCMHAAAATVAGLTPWRALWSDTILVASGTPFGAVILWKFSLPEDDCLTALQPCEHRPAEIARLGGHNGVIVRVSFSASGDILCSASDDRTIKVWERTDVGAYALRHSICGPSRVWDCAIHSGFGEHGAGVLFSCAEDGVCRVYCLISGSLQVAMKGHHGCVWRAAIAHASNLVATAGEDSSIKIWPVDHQASLADDATSKWLCSVGDSSQT